MKIPELKRRIAIPAAFILSVVLFVRFSPPGDKYFEIARNLDIFATMFKEVNTYYVDEIKPEKLMKTGIDAMLSSLDPYTNFIPEDDIEDFRTMTTGQYGGIGALIGKKGDKNIVLMPYENFPAHKSGLVIGDEIVEIDGIEIAKKATNDISKLLKGQAGTKVKIKARRFGQKEPFILDLVREKIKIENVPFSGMVADEIGYIQLSDFTSEASREVRKSLEKLKDQGCKKLIFDLRDNPGGLLSEAVNVSNLFVSKDKEVVSTKGKMTEWNKTYSALNPAFDIDIPLVVLINGKSASAAEIVSGVIQDYDRGVLIGQRSFGKGLVQATRPLSFNSQLKITTAKYYIPSGRCIQSIDYSQRGDDGVAQRVADSLKSAFKTMNGRVVYDGGGVTPDIEVEKQTLFPITQSLLNKGLLFDYATEYHQKNPKIAAAKEYVLSEVEYQEFVKWLETKDYDYLTKVETTYNELTASAKKEKYYEDIKDQLDALRKKITHNKESDILKHKSEIINLLEQEIVSRYYLEKGVKLISFRSDPEIKKAVEVLNAPADYVKTLQARK